ncbi:FAD binding domain-containing protein [Verrucomicrobiota bacterium sgz303538]
MNSFTYTRAPNAAEAVRELAARRTTKLIAGGTNLIDLMKENVVRPGRLVDINALPFAAIEEREDGGLRLGALVTNADTAYHPLVESRYPLVSKAILSGASAQLRNMATNGGNLLQRTRCQYFYDNAAPCNKREPGTGCGALHGFNRMHAILGTSEHCIATYPSDMCVAFAALEAVVQVRGVKGERAIPFSDFHRLPGDTPEIDNNLAPDEMITAIDLPPKGFAEHNTYLKVRDRESYAFALVSVAAALEMDGDTITDARLALGSVAHIPWRDLQSEALLRGQPATKQTFQKAAEAVVSGARGFGFNNFKIELARRSIVRALEQAAGLEVQP